MYHAIICESLFSLAFCWRFGYSGKHTGIINYCLMLMIIQNEKIVTVNQYRIFMMPYQEDIRDKFILSKKGI